MLLEGGSRFVLEMLRQEPAVLWRLSLSMIIGILVFAAGAGLWAIFGKAAARAADCWGARARA